MGSLIPSPRSTKGQITIFIILAAFVVLVFLVVLNKPTPESPQLKPSIQDPQTIATRVISDCLSQSLETALQDVGAVGNMEAEEVIPYENDSVGVLYDGRAVHLPTLYTYGNQIGDSMYQPLRNCIGGIDLPFDMDVDYANTAFSITFDDLNTYAKAAIPTTIRVGANEAKLRDFQSQAPVAFRKTHGIIASYLAYLAKDPFLLPITPLLTSDISAAIIPIDDHRLIIRIQDPDSSVRGMPWRMRIGISYPEGERP